MAASAIDTPTTIKRISMIARFAVIASAENFADSKAAFCQLAVIRQ